LAEGGIRTKRTDRMNRDQLIMDLDKLNYMQII